MLPRALGELIDAEMLKLPNDRLGYGLEIGIDQLLADDALRLRAEPGARAQQLVEHRRRVKLGKRRAAPRA